MTVITGPAGEVLDWQGLREQLDLVRRRWDLAVLVNLAVRAPCRPSELLAAINGQVTGRVLTAPVLSGRLKALERAGYVRHEEWARIPLRRVYYLQPAADRLLAELACLPRRRPAAMEGPAA
jgi:DNA-binding HxlR family transcriptional regulator